ncbi:ABC transporter permease subunit [Paraclostridium sordellii]|uniref:ABC transporter permease subunit n=1 Tax=Paraclostridium sordellii TaxID=1505 RepID=UPI0030D1B81B
MFSVPYFKQVVKSNIKFLLGFTLVLCMFLIVMCNVFTPEAMNELQSAAQGTIAGHILTGNGTLIGFMSNSFYALMAIIFPMVYSIMVGNRMIAEKIDKGSFVGFLSTPTTRLQITITSAVYLILSLVFMWGITSVVGIIAANILQPDALDIDTFLAMNLGAFLYHLVISGICFCSSCIFNSSKNSLTIGAGIPLLFFVVNLFMKLSNNLDFLKYFTLNTLFDTQKVLDGSGYGNEFMIMVISAIILYIVGIWYFEKKDLPL